ncbi:MAG: GIY-YIG nuclease family protein [Patescibacteria group bacterium]
MYATYIIRSVLIGKYYTGYTADMNDRMRHHNSGANKSTRCGIPWEIVYQEHFPTKKEAWLREHQIKSYKGGEAFKKLIERYCAGGRAVNCTRL